MPANAPCPLTVLCQPYSQPWPCCRTKPAPPCRPTPCPSDEWAELPEWVEHHLSIGVGKIYVMDDGSQASMIMCCRSVACGGRLAVQHPDHAPLPRPSAQPPLSTVLGPYIASGAVEHQWFDGVPQTRRPNAPLPEAAPEQLGAGASAPVPLELASGFNYSGKPCTFAGCMSSDIMRAAGMIRSSLSHVIFTTRIPDQPCAPLPHLSHRRRAVTAVGV